MFIGGKKMEDERKDIILDVEDVPRFGQWVTLSIQHLFAMFGSTVLVPFLVGLSPAVALVSSGVGTLSYLLITRGQIPAYLGSSFAFIAPIIAAKSLGGPEAAMIGCFVAGLIYGIVALVIHKVGLRWLMVLLPPVVVGPVIIVIGLSLAGTAVDMAMYDPQDKYSVTYIIIALITLAATIICNVFFKGFLNLIPILVGIIVGYGCSAIAGIIDYGPIETAKWWEMPAFMIPGIYTHFFMGSHRHHGPGRHRHPI